MALDRGPMPRDCFGEHLPSTPWPAWRIVKRNDPSDEDERWAAWAPGQAWVVVDRDGYFPTQKQALAYALEQIVEG